MHYKDLQLQLQAVERQIQQIDLAMPQGAEAYRGCWLDSAVNSAGKRYSRVRWFIGLHPKRKGCRALKAGEHAIATHAIALWRRRDQVAAESRSIERQLRAIEKQAAILGLSLI